MNTSTIRSLQYSMATMEQRISRLERHVGLTPIDALPAGPDAVRTPDSLRVQAGRPAASTLPPPLPPMMAPPPAPIAPGSAARPVVIAYQGVAPAAPPASSPQSRVEQVLGLKWAGWIGAVVLVIGAGLGIKYAYDQHLFEILTPSVRLAMMSLGGLALLAAGEWVYRRINPIAAAALYGAGVATLFFVSHAGHAYYRLYEVNTAFALMAITTLLGAAVAMRGRMVSIAVLAMIGGNLAPLVLKGDQSLLVPFLSYLLMLQVLAIWLAWWGGDGKWWTLRGLALASTALWVLSLLVPAATDRTTVLCFCIAYATLFQAELIFSRLRPRRPIPVSTTGGQSGGVVFSVLVTTALTLHLLLLTRGAAPATRGLYVLIAAAACGAIAALLAVWPRSTARRAAAGPLRFGFAVQAAALVVVAVPVMLSGAWISLGWAVLAIAFAALGAALDLKPARGGGVITWVLSVAYLVFWSRTSPAAGEVLLAIGPLVLASWIVLAWMLSAIGHAIAILTLARSADAGLPDLRRACRVTSALSSALFIVSTIVGLTVVVSTISIIVYAWLLLASGSMLDRRSALAGPPHAMTVLAVATGKWLLIDTLLQRLSPAWRAAAYVPVLNATMITGLLLAGSIVAIAFLSRPAGEDADSEGSERRRRTTSRLRAAAGAVAMFMILWGGSFEIDRFFATAAASGGMALRDPHLAGQVALSVYWSVFAVGSVVAGFRFRLAALRYAGLSLFGLTLLKVMVVDLADATTGYRILSCLAVGLLMIGTSALYGKFIPRKDPRMNTN